MTTEQLLDPTLPRLHNVTTTAEGVDYLLKHVSWCIDHPHPLHPNRPATPVTELHSLVCWLILFVDSDKTADYQRTFDHLINESNLLAASALVNFRSTHLFEGRADNLPEETFDSTDWWHRMYRLMHQLNKVYLPIFAERRRNLFWAEDTADPFYGVPDPALEDSLRTEFIDIFREVAEIRLKKGSRWQPWVHVNSLEYKTRMIRAATYEIADALYLPTTRLDSEKRAAEESRAAAERFVRSIRSTSTTP